MPTNQPISRSDVSQFLSYDCENGLLIWKPRSRSYFPSDRSFKIWSARFGGKPAGCYRADGYLVIRLFDKLYLGHRIAWFLHYGEWPQNSIDHIDGNPSNNKINNLRDVTRAENAKNLRHKANNRSGRMGVWFSKPLKKWIAEISVNGKRHHIGTFADFSEAVEARSAAERRFGFDKNHGKPRRKPIP